MSEQEKESLSALLDNEADDLELRRLLKSYESDAEIRGTWERYNLVQGLLHDEAVPVGTDFSARIREQVESEPTLSSSRIANWQQSLTKVAIAASVAAVFIVAVQTNLNQSSPVPALSQSEIAETVPVNASSQNLVAESSTSEMDPQAQQLLREYISRIEIDDEEPPHIEHIQDSPLFRLVNELQAREQALPDPQ